MRFMLMMHAPRGTGDWAVFNWTQDELKAHMEFMHALNRDLTRAGELVDAQGLATPGEAKVVRAGKNNVPVTDGVFPEATISRSFLIKELKTGAVRMAEDADLQPALQTILHSAQYPSHITLPIVPR